jgi:alkylated DNA repair dioxygenase AlkB
MPAMKKTDFKNILPEKGEAFYLPDFFSRAENVKYFKILAQEINWQQQPIKIFGKTVMQPRLTAWYADSEKLQYTYSALTMFPHVWSPALKSVKSKVEQQCDYSFNSALLNFYRDGNDSVGWHSDDEMALGKEPVIASLSLGAARKFQLRLRADKTCKVELLLEGGSLLLMKGTTQKFWEHQVPKSKVLKDPRINITLRNIFR